MEMFLLSMWIAGYVSFHLLTLFVHKLEIQPPYSITIINGKVITLFCSKRIRDQRRLGSCLCTRCSLLDEGATFLWKKHIMFDIIRLALVHNNVRRCLSRKTLSTAHIVPFDDMTPSSQSFSEEKFLIQAISFSDVSQSLQVESH